MNAAKLMKSKWVLVLGVAVLMAVMANTALADPPHRGGGDGYRGGHGGYVYHDRGRGDRWRSYAPRYGGYYSYARPVYVPPPTHYYPRTYYRSGCVVGGYYVGGGVTIIIR